MVVPDDFIHSSQLEYVHKFNTLFKDWKEIHVLKSQVHISIIQTHLFLWLTEENESSQARADIWYDPSSLILNNLPCIFSIFDWEMFEFLNNFDSIIIFEHTPVHLFPKTPFSSTDKYDLMVFCSSSYTQ